MALSLQINAFEAIQPTTLFGLSDEITDKIIFTNAIVSTLLAVIVCILVFNLLGDQLVNIFSNTTSY